LRIILEIRSVVVITLFPRLWMPLFLPLAGSACFAAGEPAGRACWAWLRVAATQP
jgi:hypothetical protein